MSILHYIDSAQHAAILDYTSVDDHRSAIQAALNDSQSVEFPPGRYNVNTDTGPINFPKGGRVIGTGGGPNWNHKTGAWIKIAGNTNPCFAFEKEIAAENIGFDYPDQVDSDTPITYPATFASDPNKASAGAHFRDVVATRGTTFYRVANGNSGKGAGRAWFRDCRFHTLGNAIDVDESMALIEVVNTMFGLGVLFQLTDFSLPKLATYTRHNAVAVRLGGGTLDMYGGIVFGCNGGLLCDDKHYQGGVHNVLFDQVIEPVMFSGGGWPGNFIANGCQFTNWDQESPSRESLGAIVVSGPKAGKGNMVVSGCYSRWGPFMRVTTQNSGGRYVVGDCVVERTGLGKSSGEHNTFVFNDSEADLSVSNVISDMGQSLDPGISTLFASVVNARDVQFANCKAVDYNRFLRVSEAANEVYLSGNLHRDIHTDQAVDAGQANRVVNNPDQWQ